MVGKFSEEKKPSLEDQLAYLKELGYDLNPGITNKHLLTGFARTDYENDPYLMLLATMGSETKIEDGTWVPFSDKVWNFDSECIYVHGDYSKIVHRLLNLTEGSLPITDVKDYVDMDARKAWISFSLDGKEIKWNLSVEDDWVDFDVFTKFEELLASRGDSKSLIIMPDGQGCLIAYADANTLKKLNELPGLEFEFLK